MGKIKKGEKLKVVVFCGGVGTRLWPLSREKTPKQFLNIIGEQTLLQNTVYNRLRPEIPWEDIYLSTGRCYLEEVKREIPEVLPGNLILEPVMRDTGPAVALAMAKIGQKYPHSPVAVLWQDHLVKNVSLFKEVLFKAAELVRKKTKLVYIAIPPRFASVNLGYIKTGNLVKEEGEMRIYKFAGFTEKPDLKTAESFLKEGDYFWNPGYFVTTPQFLLEVFRSQKNHFDIYDGVERIRNSLGTPSEEQVLSEVFPKMNKVAVDYVVHENLPYDNALVVVGDIGWSDIGEWRALKEALEKSPEDNIIKGEVVNHDSFGCLVYSFSKKLIATVGLKNTIIVDTNDVTLVCSAEKAAEVKKLVAKLKKMRDKGEHL